MGEKTSAPPSINAAVTETAVAGSADAFNALVLEALDRFSGETCFRIWRNGRYRDVSYRHLRRQTLRLARALSELELGGQRVALWAANSPEWMVAYLAAQLAGSVVVPMRQSLPRRASLRQLRDSGARLLVLGTRGQAERLVGAELPHLKHVLVIEESEEGAPAGVDWPFEVLHLSELVSERLETEARRRVLDSAREVDGDALAVISYTTTQTGEPLGAVFSQAQRGQAMATVGAWFTLHEDDLAFTALPWGYPPSLDVSLHYLLSGIANVLSQGRELMLEEFRQASPTVALTTPHALERAYEEIIDDYIRRLPDSTQEMFFWALGTSKKVLAAGADASPELRERYQRADRTFFSRIRGAFGGRFRRFLSTGAPLPRPLAESIQAVGLEPINLYSVTESGGFPSVNDARGRRLDACGDCAPGFEIKLEDGGQILVRGTTVMRGYWRQDEATSR
ncbi:MAG: AMP-binding protein, partial [Acidobacteriota bacterium]